MPLHYHEGQLEVQREANTTHVADKLASWVGPVAEYATRADLFLLAVDDRGALRFAALSGPAPLARVAGPGRLRLDPVLTPVLPVTSATSVGGLAISLAERERARINGVLEPRDDGVLDLVASEVFTLCRKYMHPTTGLDEVPVAGPARREPIDPQSPWVKDLIANAQTAFLASVSPDGLPDVAHRGGPGGFLELDPTGRELRWPEFVGDGVFKSAGNVRANASATLLVPDLASGDAVEIVGRATYETLRFERRPRTDALLRFRDAYPLQGRMTLQVERVDRLRGLAWPRAETGDAPVTSSSSVDDQAPR